jgi:hypothetical protein
MPKMTKVPKIADEYHFIIKKVERSDSTLRHSIFDILRFCGFAVRFLSKPLNGYCQYPTVPALAQVLPSCRQGRGGRIGNMRKICRQTACGFFK